MDNNIMQLSSAELEINLNELIQNKNCEEMIYKEVNCKKLRILAVKPVNWIKSDERTAIVWIHGGGWTLGNPELYLPHCQYFAKRGAVSLSIQYRLIEDNNAMAISDCIADVKSAIRYIRKNANELGISQEKIIVIGDSAGGHLAICLATIIGFDDTSDDKSISPVPNAIVNCNGVVDLTNHFQRTVIEKKLIVDTEEKNIIMDYARKISPTYNISRGLPPLLNLQGEKDGTVSPEMTIKFHNDLLKAGNKSRLILWPDAKHAFILIGYTATDEQIVRAIKAIDDYIVYLGLL